MMNHLVFVLLLCFVALGGFIHADAASTDAELLQRSEVSVLSQRAKAVANILGLAFEAMISDMGVFKNTSEALINGKTQIKAYSTSYASSGAGPGSTAVNLHSGWFNKQSSSSSAAVNKNLDLTSLFRHAWLTVQPNWLGLGFGDPDALTRFYPFSTNTGLSTHTSTCISSNATLNGTTVTGYDPRCRGWYATAEVARSEIHFSEPYTDATTGETVTTVSTAVMNTTDGTLFGVLFGDVSLTYLKSVINEGWPTANAMKGDHRFLLHESGSIVVSNVFTAGATLAESLYPSSASLRASFVATDLPSMVGAIKSQRLVYTLADNTRYVGAVSPVAGTKYHVGVFSLESNLDAFTTTNAIKEIGNDIAAYVTRFLESAFFQNLQAPHRVFEEISTISSEIQYQTSYQDDTVALSSSLTLTQDARLPARTGKICLSDSTWFITDHTSSTTQSAEQTTLIQQTQLLDPYFRSIYSTSPNYVTWLFCSGSSSKVFRKYPGSLTSDLTYDCSGRHWYTAAVAQSGKLTGRNANSVLYFWTAFTPAYKDAFSGEWMISASIQMASPGNVFGVDLLLNTLSAVFKDIEFFTTGKATLVDLTDGTIIADKTLFLDASTKAYSYTDLTSPSVSNTIFNEFIAASKKTSDRSLLTSTSETNGDCYFLYFTTLAHGNLDRYGVIMSVKSLADTSTCESLTLSGSAPLSTALSLVAVLVAVILQV